MPSQITTGIIIPARMNSEHLPGKVLLKINDRPALGHVIDRLRHVKGADQIVVATTRNPADDKIEYFCKQENVPCFRGSEDDLLGRLFECAILYKFKVVIRVNGNCPLTDPAIVDQLIEGRYDNHADYATNRMDSTFPKGLEADVFSTQCLKRVEQQATSDWDRESIVSYIMNHMEAFQIHTLQEEDSVAHYRWVLDTKEDYHFLREVYGRLGRNGFFRTPEIVSLMKLEPSLEEINADSGRDQQDDD